MAAIILERSHKLERRWMDPYKGLILNIYIKIQLKLVKVCFHQKKNMREKTCKSAFVIRITPIMF